MDWFFFNESLLDWKTKIIIYIANLNFFLQRKYKIVQVYSPM